jgi:hypothetical protein
MAVPTVSILLLIGIVLVGLALLVALFVAALSRGSQRHPRLVGCPHCGRNVLPGAGTCSNCGQPVS